MVSQPDTASYLNCPMWWGCGTKTPSLTTSTRGSMGSLLTGLGFKASSFKPRSFGTTHTRLLLSLLVFDIA